MTAKRYQRILDVLAKRQPDLSVLAEDVYKPHNLSAMLRTCDAVGVGTVHAVTPTGGVPTFNETSASADKWIDLRVYDTLTSALDPLRESGLQLLATHLSDRAVDYRDVDYTQPTCIIFGNEKRGVSPEAAMRADQNIVIPMLGMVQSLNVSVATAVILFEAQRQRRAAGLYGAPRLSPEQINDQAFRWLYPREAEQFAREGRAFPPLSETGAVMGRWSEALGSKE